MGDFLTPSLDPAIRASTEVPMGQVASVPDTPPRGDGSTVIVLDPGTVSVTLRFEDGGGSVTNPGDGTGSGPTTPEELIYLDDLQDVETFGASSPGLILISESVGPTTLRWVPEPFLDLANQWLDTDEAQGNLANWFMGYIDRFKMREFLGYEENGEVALDPARPPGTESVDVLEPWYLLMQEKHVPKITWQTIVYTLGYRPDTGMPLEPLEGPPVDEDGYLVDSNGQQIKDAEGEPIRAPVLPEQPEAEFDPVLDGWWERKEYVGVTAETVLNSLNYTLEGEPLVEEDPLLLDPIIAKYLADHPASEEGGEPLTYVAILRALGYDETSGNPLPQQIARLAPALAWHWGTVEFKNFLRVALTSGLPAMVNRTSLGYAEEAVTELFPYPKGAWLGEGEPMLDPIIDQYLARHPLDPEGNVLTRSVVMGVLGYDEEGDPLPNESQALSGIMYSYFIEVVPEYLEDWWANLPAADIVQKLGYNPVTGVPTSQEEPVAGFLDPVIENYLARNPIEGEGPGGALTRQAVVDALDYVEDSASFLIDRPENRVYTFVLAYVPIEVIATSAQMASGDGNVSATIDGGNLVVTVTGANSASRDARGFVKFKRNFS